MAQERTLNIGTDADTGGRFTVPVELATEALALVGTRGKGKSTTARVIVEELIKCDVPVIVLDTVGVWWGLRSDAAGTGPGLPVVVFGGAHADVPIVETAGSIVAETLIEHGAPAVVDLSGFTKGGKIRFSREFLETLYFEAASRRTPVHVVFDEVDEFAPQRPAPAAAALYAASDELVRRGRARGLGASMISQRPSVIAKDVLTQASLLFAHGLTHKLDVNAITDWVGLNDPEHVDLVRSTLPSLQPGEAWAWSPAWLGILRRVRVRQPETFDSSATPKVGQKLVVPKRLAPVDIAKLGARIQDSAEQARASDPKALRAQLAEVRAQLAAAQARLTEAPDPSVETRVVEVPIEVLVPVLDTKRIVELRGLVDELEESISAVRARVEDVRTVLDMAEQTGPASPVRMPTKAIPPAEATTFPTPRVVDSPSGPAAFSVPKPEAPDRSVDATEIARAAGLGLAERRILRELAYDSMPNERLALLSGYKIKSSTMRSALGKLRSGGFITGSREANAITDLGRQALGPVPERPSGQALIDMWMSRLGAAERAFLTIAINAWPAPVSNDDLTAATGYEPTSSTVRSALGRLRSLTLIRGDRTANYADDELGAAAH